MDDESLFASFHLTIPPCNNQTTEKGHIPQPGAQSKPIRKITDYFSKTRTKCNPVENIHPLPAKRSRKETAKSASGRTSNTIDHQQLYLNVNPHASDVLLTSMPILTNIRRTKLLIGSPQRGKRMGSQALNNNNDKHHLRQLHPAASSTSAQSAIHDELYCSSCGYNRAILNGTLHSNPSVEHMIYHTWAVDGIPIASYTRESRSTPPCSQSLTNNTPPNSTISSQFNDKSNIDSPALPQSKQETPNHAPQHHLYNTYLYRHTIIEPADHRHNVSTLHDSCCTLLSPCKPILTPFGTTYTLPPRVWSFVPFTLNSNCHSSLTHAQNSNGGGSDLMIITIPLTFLIQSCLTTRNNIPHDKEPGDHPVPPSYITTSLLNWLINPQLIPSFKSLFVVLSASIGLPSSITAQQSRSGQGTRHSIHGNGYTPRHGDTSITPRVSCPLDSLIIRRDMTNSPTGLITHQHSPITSKKSSSILHNAIKPTLDCFSSIISLLTLPSGIITSPTHSTPNTIDPSQTTTTHNIFKPHPPAPFYIALVTSSTTNHVDKVNSPAPGNKTSCTPPSLQQQTGCIIIGACIFHKIPFAVTREPDSTNDGPSPDIDPSIIVPSEPDQYSGQTTMISGSVPTAVPAKVGIDALWVSSSYRHHGVATAMVDCAYHRIMASHSSKTSPHHIHHPQPYTLDMPPPLTREIRRTHIAFSEPTEHGDRFCRAYTGTPRYLEYIYDPSINDGHHR